VKRFLKYFIPSIIVLVAVVSIRETEQLVYTIPQVTENAVVTQFNLDAPTSDSDRIIPRQRYGTNVLRLQNTTKKTHQTNKNHFEFIRPSKTVRTGIKNFIQKEALITHSSFIKPGYKLLWLSKLII
jgi:hypothetical protein